jgi:phosphoglycerate dehydrogenase-like enzyme
MVYNLRRRISWEKKWYLTVVAYPDVVRARVPREPKDTELLHNRFGGVKNILYTPQMSGETREAMNRALRQPLANIVRLYNDEKPLYIINED